MTDQTWDFSAIDASLAELDREVAATLATLDQQRSLMSLVAGCWGGTGSDAWQGQQSRWQQKADADAAALQALAAALHVATSHMRDVESTVGTLFS